MEKSKSVQDYPCSYVDGRFGFGLDERTTTKSYSFNGPVDPNNNPEAKRRKRVAAYNMYTTEGKLKSSLRSSFKWIKSKFTDDYYEN